MTLRNVKRRDYCSDQSIAPQHALNQLAKRPVPLGLGFFLSALVRQSKLFHKQDVVLEAGVEVGLEAKTADDAVVMAVDVGVDSVQTLEDLFDGGLEGSREGDARLGGEEGGVGEEIRGPRE